MRCSISDSERVTTTGISAVAQQVFMKSLFKQCVEHGIVGSAKLITSNVKSDVTLGAASKYAP